MFHIYINGEGYVTPTGKVSAFSDRAQVYGSITTAKQVLRCLGVTDTTSVIPGMRTGYVCEALSCGTRV